MILNSDAAQFSVIAAASFQAQEVMTFISSWPRVPSEYKLQVIAEALLAHYKENPGFADNLSQLLNALLVTNINTASYRLGKIISSWLHQQWATLPCADLSNHEAYRLFPEHALAPPSIPRPIKVFKPDVSSFMGQYKAKTLYRPLDWEGALDGFSHLLDTLPQPKKMSVIGFGDGKELLLLNQKWPETKIHGFETQKRNKFKPQLDLIAVKPNITIHYDEQPASYKHHDETIDFALIRHPNSLGDAPWNNIVMKTLASLAPDGTLLINFYSKKEMRALKKKFIAEAGSEYVWSEKVNPHAYNPAFMSQSGSYSFDLILVTIRSKLSNQPDLLSRLTADKTRKHEVSDIEPKGNQNKFVVVEHDKLSILTRPGFYEELHKEKTYAGECCCFKCKKPSADYYRMVVQVGGKSPIEANVDLCEKHVTATKQDFEKMLKEPWSAWSDREPVVHAFHLVGRGVSKKLSIEETSSAKPVPRL